MFSNINRIANIGVTEGSKTQIMIFFLTASSFSFFLLLKNFFDLTNDHMRFQILKRPVNPLYSELKQINVINGAFVYTAGYHLKTNKRITIHKNANFREFL